MSGPRGPGWAAIQSSVDAASEAVGFLRSQRSATSSPQVPATPCSGAVFAQVAGQRVLGVDHQGRVERILARLGAKKAESAGGIGVVGDGQSEYQGLSVRESFLDRNRQGPWLSINSP